MHEVHLGTRSDPIFRPHDFLSGARTNQGLIGPS